MINVIKPTYKANKLFLIKFYGFILLYASMAVFIIYLAWRGSSVSEDAYYNLVSADIKLSNNRIIIIDPGHGGFDGGASDANGTLEKDLNLEVSLKLRDLFELAGFTVILTRDSDVSTGDSGSGRMKASDLSNRVKIADKYPDAVFISIHMNKFPQENVKGMQVFYSPNNADSRELAAKIKELNKLYFQQSNHREEKEADNIFVMENIKNCGVLVECGFLSNPDEAQKLADNIYQNKISYVIFGATCDFLFEESEQNTALN